MINIFHDIDAKIVCNILCVSQSTYFLNLFFSLLDNTSHTTGNCFCLVQEFLKIY